MVSQGYLMPRECLCGVCLKRVESGLFKDRAACSCSNLECTSHRKTAPLQANYVTLMYYVLLKSDIS
jgi:hypothetical protein